MSRLEKIAAMLRENQLDAVVLTHGDNLVYATAMPGIEGVAVITADSEGWLFTDSRYIEDATARRAGMSSCPKPATPRRPAPSRSYATRVSS